MGDFFLFIIYFFPFLLMFFGFLLVLFLFFYLFCVYLFYLILVLLVLFVLIYLNVMVYNDIDVIFCMNLLLESDYFVGDLRLLQCNQCLFLFSLCMYKFWLSSIDVIHSFTIACLGIKCDCIPGRCVELLLFCFF